MRTTVYRIQDADGRGPWKPGFSQHWSTDKPAEVYEKLQPIMTDFPNLSVNTNRHIGVGCTSLEQLRMWIWKIEYERLLQHGYQCVKIRADRIAAQSDIQCVFESAQPLKDVGKPVRLYEVTS